MSPHSPIAATNKIFPPPVYTEQFVPPTLRDFTEQKFGASSVLDLKKYTLIQLKAFAQYYKLHITGTKTVLYDRLIDYFVRGRAAQHIQRVFRGHLVREAVALRAAAAARRGGEPVNETDFYTLEPVRDIPYLEVYGFTDERAHLFVFHIHSITTLIMRGGGLDNEPVNPYTREKIPDNIILEVLRYIRLQRILWPEIEILHPSLYKFLWKCGGGGISVIQKLYTQQQILQKLHDIREKPNTQRAVALFAEIDLLGNYTSADWFLNLSIKEVYFYWNILYDLWLYRAGILADTKMQICPLHAPFEGKNLTQMTDLTYGVVIDATLYAMENMVYMSDNEEYRKLGCMYVLMALTVVSPEARVAFPYLFENIAY